jgi:TonB-dependent starch-binding outer membrane protein SusC
MYESRRLPSVGPGRARQFGSRLLVATFLLLTLFLTPTLVGAQNGTITGTVTDSRTGQAIPAAQVFLAEPSLGSLTTQNGRYTIQNVPPGARTVSARRIGYREGSQTITVGPGETATLNFAITEEALSLGEIIVTGTPGGTQRRAIGNTVSTVRAAEVVENVTITGMQDLLAGRTPGLQFTALSGSVGTGSPIQIRGVGSFSGDREQPLVFVDGIRVNNSASAGPTLGQGDQVSVLDDFNPEDIESVEIIKGPAAASLYGTEAASFRS